ncbi:MAG: T9SS type A sorting domain-containing protein [Flavobacteriales bacterium]|nr:T9SS type A sorting domain-containing protein [Flavobacteriales bacterium]
MGEIYGGLHLDVARDIISTDDGGYAVVGSKWDGGYGRQDFYLLKLDGLGNQIWDSYIGGYNMDDGISLKQTSDGGYIMSGYTRSYEFPGDYFLVKTDNVGTEEWSTFFGTNGKDIAFDVIETSEGDYLVTGLQNGFFEYSTFDFKEADSDIGVYKVSAMGDIIWDATYGGDQNELVGQTIESPNGGYYIIGSTQSLGSGSFDIYLLKIDISGNVEWETTYGDILFDYGTSIDISDDNFLYITGTTNTDSETNKTDMITIKAELDGTEIWTAISGGNGSEYGKKIKAIESGCAVLGNTNSYGSGLMDIYFIVYSDQGEPQLLNVNNFVLNDFDVNIYPNPVSEDLTISVSEKYLCDNFIYELSTMNGELVYTNKSGSNNIKLTVSTLSPGMYLYKIKSDCDITEVSGKFIVH